MRSIGLIVLLVCAAFAGVTWLQSGAPKAKASAPSSHSENAAESVSPRHHSTAAKGLNACQMPTHFNVLYQQAIELLGKSELDASLTQYFQENFSGLNLKRPARDEWNTNIVESRCGLEFVFARAEMAADKGKGLKSGELVLSHVMFSTLMVDGVAKNSPPVVGAWQTQRKVVRSSLGVPSWSSPYMKVDQWDRDGLKLTIDFNEDETEIKKLTLGIY